MTQSGQGEEPSAREAREGIVLPSDGGEPLLPGMTSGYGGQQSAPQPAHRPGQQPPPPSAPAGGQSWGTPWGPEQHQPPAPAPGQDWQPQQWGTPEQQQPQTWAAQDQSQPLPAEGTTQAYGDMTPQAPHGPHGQAPGPDTYPAPGSGAPLPPEGSYHAPGTAAIPSSAGHGDAAATQYLPPALPGAHGPAGDAGPQYFPPAAASGDEGATQYIPPVAPGALPPERPAESPAEATQFLGRTPQPGPGPLPPAGPQPSAGPLPGAPGAGPLPPATGPDAEATQYIPPVSGQAAFGQERQPPAEFDSLFRSGPGADSPAAATQHLPRFAQPEASPQPSYVPPRPVYDEGDGGGGGGRGGRTGSRVPLIAAVGIAIAVLGVGAGALLAGGGGGDKSDKNQTVSATAPATEGSQSASADPARQQAVALDKLLADSGSSRTSVINAVGNVKSCTNLGQAAKDLRSAAAQRGDLVTRLSGLSVDRLPAHAALTSALTKAWQASAAADNHYAAWADQVSGKKGCKKGQARTTGQTQAGNRSSGTASAEKAKAAQLWNTIAKKYGLTQRSATQL